MPIDEIFECLLYILPHFTRFRSLTFNNAYVLREGREKREVRILRRGNTRKMSRVAVFASTLGNSKGNAQVIGFSFSRIQLQNKKAPTALTCRFISEFIHLCTHCVVFGVMIMRMNVFEACITKLSNDDMNKILLEY